MATAAKAKPKQQPLKGMEERVIQDLQDKAIEYADVRDERMKLSRQEGELQGELLALMHKHKKKTYAYQGVEITVVVEKEKAKVKVKSVDDEDPEEAEEAEG
jgi:hypothetical protein